MKDEAKAATLEAPAHDWHAVRFDRLGAIAFSPAEVPAEIRTELEKRGGQVVDGVAFSRPQDLDRSPHGEKAPDAVLCVSRGDDRNFRVFKYQSDIDRAAFEDTGKNCYVIASRSGWIQFAEGLRDLDAIASHTDEADTPENWEAIRREIRESRGVDEETTGERPA